MRDLVTSSTLLVALSLLAAACSSGEPDARTDDGGRTPEPPSATTAPADESLGETARYVVDGDTVLVNNELCGVSRTRMGPETLGKFVSRVTYSGPNEEFRGKTLLFNQCCAMCLDRFPKRWADDPDEILAFHGLAGQLAKSP